MRFLVFLMLIHIVYHSVIVTIGFSLLLFLYYNIIQRRFNMSEGKLIHIKDYLNTSLDDLKKEMESLDNLMGKYQKQLKDHEYSSYSDALGGVTSPMADDSSVSKYLN
jgi:uncharacterized protein YlxW (UPF0749 family)